MLKIISAALLAASVLAVAPAMAHGPGRIGHAPDSVYVDPGMLDANAWMGRHHHRHFRHHDRYFRHHDRHFHHHYRFHRHHWY